LALEAGLDLVVVSESANPPVAKIIDFQKFKYQESKKVRSGSAKSVDTKEVRLTPFMAQNDLANRLSKARAFLTSGNRVKLVVKFTGRQITRREFGESLLTNAIINLNDISTLDQNPKWQGKLYYCQLKPSKGKKNDQIKN